MELEILHWFESLHNSFLNPVMYFFTLIGEYGAVWIIMAVLMIFVQRKRYGRDGISVAIALILSLVMCNLIMKNLFVRVRPFNADTSFENVYGIFNQITDWSFPSGHTSASFAAAMAVFMWHKKEGTAALVLAMLIALSRLYFTVHYPTDVLASMILGSLYGVAAYYIVRFLKVGIEK